MKMYFRVTLGFILLLLIGISCSCGESESMAVVSFPAPPEPMNFFEGILELESDYSLVSATTLKPEYSIETDVIKCRIVNEHAGYGFYYCTRPYLERQENGVWRNVSLKDENLPNSESWVLCAIPDKPKAAFSSVFSFRLSAAKENLSKGYYRVRIGLGQGECTAEFFLID